MNKLLKVVLWAFVAFMGLWIILMIVGFAAMADCTYDESDISEEGSIEHVEVNTGLEIDECEFLLRDIHGSFLGDDSFYEMRFDDDSILEQIQADTFNDTKA